jgi:prevent-host-death family protein
MSEMRVGTRELKNKLSEYLRRVKAGETIFVTEHGRTIGQIIPVGTSVRDKMEAMIASGRAEWNGASPVSYRTTAENKGKYQISDLIVEDRE